MYREPMDYSVLRANWLKKQPRTIQKFFKLLDSMTYEQKREFFEDIENLGEWKEMEGAGKC